MTDQDALHDSLGYEERLARSTSAGVSQSVRRPWVNSPGAMACTGVGLSGGVVGGWGGVSSGAYSLFAA